MGDHGSINEANGRVGTIEPAVGQLIRRLIESDARPGPADEADEIILDIEVHGVRYLAIRCGTRSAPTAEPTRRQDPGAAQPHSGSALSPREFEIARMVAKGYANKTIASVLGISSWTVSSHLRRSFSKLGVTSRAAMVAQLLDDGPSREPPIVALSDQPLAWPARTEPVRPSSEARARTIQVLPDADRWTAEAAEDA
jgi:DNA-binding CsgD family transcriptional regulator